MPTPTTTDVVADEHIERITRCLRVEGIRCQPESIIPQSELSEHPLMVGGRNARLAYLDEDGNVVEQLSRHWYDPASGEVTSRSSNPSRFSEVDSRYLRTTVDAVQIDRNALRLFRFDRVHADVATFNQYGYNSNMHYAIPDGGDLPVLRYAYSYSDSYKLQLPASFGMEVPRTYLDRATTFLDSIDGDDPFDHEAFVSRFVGGDTTYRRLAALIVEDDVWQYATQDDCERFSVWSL